MQPETKETVVECYLECRNLLGRLDAAMAKLENELKFRTMTDGDYLAYRVIGNAKRAIQNADMTMDLYAAAKLAGFEG